MSTTAPKSATTPIPVQLSEPEFTANRLRVSGWFSGVQTLLTLAIVEAKSGSGV